MASAVRIDPCAFDDPRFALLARHAGLADADHARGKMIRLWSYCTDRRIYVVPGDEIDAIVGVENFCRAAVQARLGEDVDGGVRLRGTRGRIEWREKLKKNARKGGQARASQMAAKRQPNGVPKDSHLTSPPSPSPSPSPSQSQKEISSSQALAARLGDLILERDPKSRDLQPERKEKTVARWANDIRLLHERDGRDYAEILETLEWCQADPFWRTNILSGGKFREQFSALRQKMATGRPQPKPKPNLGRLLDEANREEPPPCP